MANVSTAETTCAPRAAHRPVGEGRADRPAHVAALWEQLDAAFPARMVEITILVVEAAVAGLAAPRADSQAASPSAHPRQSAASGLHTANLIAHQGRGASTEVAVHCMFKGFA